MTLVLQFLNPALVELHYPVNLSAMGPYQWDILAIDMYFPKKKKKKLSKTGRSTNRPLQNLAENLAHLMVDHYEVGFQIFTFMITRSRSTKSSTT